MNKTFIKDLKQGDLFTYDYSDTYEVLKHYPNQTTLVNIYHDHQPSDDIEKVDSSEDIIPIIKFKDLFITSL